MLALWSQPQSICVRYKSAQLPLLYHAEGVSIPVAFEIIRKPIEYCDLKTQKVKCRAELTKNELMRQMLTTSINNQLKFKYVLMDIWFSSKENMIFIKHKHNRDFVCTLKFNRPVARSKDDEEKERFSRIDTLDLQEEMAVKVWIKGVGFPILLIRKTFKNKDKSSGTLCLACSDLNVDGEGILAIYKNDGASRFCMNLSSKMPRWPSRQHIAPQPSLTIFSQASSPSSSSSA